MSHSKVSSTKTLGRLRRLDMNMFILASLLILLFGSPALAAQEVKDDDFLVVQTLWNLEDQLLQLINEEGSRPERNVLRDLGIEPKIYALISLLKIKHLVEEGLAKVNTFHRNQPYQSPFSIY